jgi:hypothetical protein
VRAAESVLACKVLTRVVRRYKIESEVNIVCTVTPRQGHASVAALFAQERAKSWGMRLLDSGPSESIGDYRLPEEESALGMIKESIYAVQACLE